MAIVVILGSVGPSVDAQPAGGKMFRIGILSLGRAPARSATATLQQRLGELGYTVGRDVVFETRYAEEQIDVGAHR